jgi:acyl-coenzyme A thioesterase PaaI-like protein
LVTIQLNLNFVRPARVGDILHATGQVLHSGRRTALSRGEVRNASNSLVATATATLMFLPNVMPPERNPEGQGAPTGPRDMGATGEGP